MKAFEHDDMDRREFIRNTMAFIAGLAALEGCAASNVRYSRLDVAGADEYFNAMPGNDYYIVEKDTGEPVALASLDKKYQLEGWKKADVKSGADLDKITREIWESAEGTKPRWSRIEFNPIVDFYTPANVKQLAYYARLNGNKIEGIHPDDFKGASEGGGGDAGGGGGSGGSGGGAGF